MDLGALYLLLCGFCGLSYWCWLKVIVLFCVIALTHKGKLTGASFGTVNCTMPSLDDAA